MDALLASEPGELEAGANAPLALDAGAVWLVRSGAVEVFAVPAGEGGGPRTHLGTAGPGTVLFGARGGGGLALLAVGVRGARVTRVARVVGPRGLGAPPAVAAAIDGWVRLLTRGLARGAAPKAFRDLAPGVAVRLDAPGEAARPRDGVVWVRHEEGSSRLLGRPSFGLAPGGFAPVAEEAWLVGDGGVGLACAGTAERLAAGAVWEELERWVELYLGDVQARIAEAAREDRARLERRTERDRLTVQGAAARLASVLSPVEERETRLAEEAADPLFVACRLVGRAQGIDIRPLPESIVARPGDLLGRICAGSRVRCRRVILRDDWWRRDNGPLVAFRVLDPSGNPSDKERRPVALLPTSPASYDVVDPVERTRAPVDAALAESLSGDAFMFYPPLPERPLRPADLVRAAFGDRRRDLATIVLMGLAGGLLATIVPLLTGHVFGQVIPGADRARLWQVVAALVVAAIGAGLFQVVRSFAVLRLGGKMDGSLQAAVWDRLLALPVSFFRRFSVGDLTERSLGIDAIRELLTGNVVTSVLAAVFSLFSFALLFYYSRRLALVATGLVVVLLATTGLLTWLQVRRQRELLALQGRIASLVLGVIGGIAKLRVAGAERRAFALWAERFAEKRQKAIEAQRLANAQAAFNAVMAIVTTLAIFAAVGFPPEGEEPLPLGEFLAFNAAFGQFLSAALAMIGVFSSALTMVPIYERLSPILEASPEVDATKPDAGELAGEVEFSHVSFRYAEGGPLILDDVSFKAAPGEFIALVGPSGAGKSTCLRLLLGFESPSSGSIYYDGQDLATIGVQSVRRQIGVVLQSGRLMGGSVYSNIVGGANLGIDAAWEAARLAGLEEDIKAMPMGMHTVVSEGAGTFSGGQKQRLLIARAIVQRPRIVLFDEATSALDNRTQDLVSTSLERLKATRIVIAHRLSTIVNADRIYVLEGGRVAEVGPYAELVARGGLFARLVERQIA